MDNTNRGLDKYRINTENGGFKLCIWLEADVRGIYPTYLIVEEVSKTIEIINSRMYVSLQLWKKFFSFWELTIHVGSTLQNFCKNLQEVK